MIFQLGYERENVEKSDPSIDVAHAAYPRDKTKAICGAKLGTTFANILFGTGLLTTQSGVPKCETCLEMVTRYEA